MSYLCPIELFRNLNFFINWLFQWNTKHMCEDGLERFRDQRVQIKERRSGGPTRPDFFQPGSRWALFFQPDIAPICHSDPDPIGIGPARFIPMFSKKYLILLKFDF